MYLVLTQSTHPQLIRDLMGHSYYSENRSVLSDIYYLIQEDRSPDKRFGLEPKLTPDGKYWIFKQ